MYNNDVRGVIVMPVIKPISDLRNYNQVLEKVSVGSPVYGYQ